MSSTSSPDAAKPEKGGISSHILPLLLTLVIPAFSLWFFNRAETNLDDQIRKELIDDISRSSEITAEERELALEFYGNLKVSEVMASNDPEVAELQAMFEPAALRYANFRWGKRISAACLASTLFALLFVGAGAAWSLRSQKALYQSLRIGWPTLRTIAAFQVLAQGALAVALSFWVTALWMEFYSLKLIGILALLAICAIAMMFKAIFSKYDPRFEQMGELLPEDRAPALWARIREIASNLGTSPPDQILLGTDSGFYVTENDVWLNDRRLEGRTLFMSLPLLKTLDTAEADAVIGHEMAHFSGEDTMWTRKVAPYLQRMQIYIAHLAESPLAIPVFHFLLFFWKLYQFSYSRMSRQREFRADMIGAETSSPTSLARSLVKIAAYCEYRYNTEEEIMLKEDVASRPEIALRLANGFPEFFTNFTADPKSLDTETSHPFDTHPPLADRLQAVGCSMDEIRTGPDLLNPASQSWHDAIADASAMEEAMWKKEEEMMVEAREMHRAMTIIPQSEEDRQLVAKHFPERTFNNSKGETVVIDHAGIRLSNTPEQIRFEDVVSMDLHDSIGKDLLHLSHTPSGGDESKTHKFRPEAFTDEEGNLMEALSLYYGRHMHAKALAEE